MANNRFGLFQSPYHVSHLVEKVYSYLPISSFPDMHALCNATQSAEIQLSRLQIPSTDVSLQLQQERMMHWFRYSKSCHISAGYIEERIIRHPDFHEKSF